MLTECPLSPPINPLPPSPAPFTVTSKLRSKHTALVNILTPNRSPLTDKDVDDYYTRKRHLPDLAARGTLPLHVLKMSQDQHREQQQHQSQAAQSSISQAPPQSQSSQQQSQQRQRPRRVQRAMSQDRVLSPQRAPQQDYSMSSNGMSPYGGRILSDEQLLSAERLRSQERLLPQDRHTSQDRLYSKDRMYSKDRLLSQDHLYSKDRHYSQDRLYSQERLYSQDRLLSQDPLLSPDKLMMSLKRGMVSSISGGFRGSDKRTHTVEQLHYIPQHHQQQQQPQHYRTGSKTEKGQEEMRLVCTAAEWSSLRQGSKEPEAAHSRGPPTAADRERLIQLFCRS
ncbi:hypothetical protein INR49_028558 [Caranx melampygus]|nr:hypothetical protein INR49_028558 [Caranx melampygus]